MNQYIVTNKFIKRILSPEQENLIKKRSIDNKVYYEKTKNKKQTKNVNKTKDLYQIWYMMMSRCYDFLAHDYDRYGGRGIRVCDKWKNYSEFFKDLAPRPANKTLERIDNNKNYCKENCRWATRQEQANNRKNNVFIEYKNKKITVAEASRITGIRQDTLMWRLKNNKPLFNAPRKYNRRIN